MPGHAEGVQRALGLEGEPALAAALVVRFPQEQGDPPQNQLQYQRLVEHEGGVQTLGPGAVPLRQQEQGYSG